MPADITTYFDADGKLNDNGIALCADAVVLNRVEELPKKLREQLEESAECRKQVMALAELLNKENLKTEYHPFFDRQAESGGGWSQFLKIAAVLLISIMIGLVVYINIDPAQAPEVPPTEIFAQNFESNPFYESLVGQTLRTGVNGAEIISPDIDEELNLPVTFEWTGMEEMTLHFQLLNNRAEAIYTETVTGFGITYDEPLDPGLYYWRLETDDQLIHVGRFTVN